MTKLSKKLIVSSVVVLAALGCRATTPYVTVMKPGKVFDEPNAKGYVSLNTRNEEVNLVPGMVFKVIEKGNGWDIVEYSPGLRGYVPSQIIGQPDVLPKGGTYKVANNPKETLTISTDGKGWKAISGTTILDGQIVGNAIIFSDKNGNQVYSLVELADGPVVMTYVGSVTGFF